MMGVNLEAMLGWLTPEGGFLWEFLRVGTSAPFNRERVAKDTAR